MHPTPAPSAAVIAAAVAGAVAAGGDEQFLTAVLTIALATMLTGAVFLLVGGLRLGNLVRFTPYPVVAGFLAGTGWLLVEGSLDVMTSAHWIPGVAFGIALVAVARRLRSPVVLPVGALVGLLAFYLVAVPPARRSMTSSGTAGCSARSRRDPCGARGRWTRSASRTGEPSSRRRRPLRR